MAASVSSAITPSLAVVRLLQSFNKRSVPIGFVASQLGLDDGVVRQHINVLVDQNVVQLDGDSVSIT
jgi:predicted ArsR family transcriptional regulator